ncbi:MAG: MBL fold metallo-hydrolase [Thermoplasmata archaeon]
MPRLTCYGGVARIGGNKFLLEDGDARIFLDMGQTFDFLEDYFVDPWLLPRQRFGLRDYFALDLMPRIPGLYDEAKLEDTGMDWEQPVFDGIFISHPHFDHIFHLQFIDRNIPVHLGETARIITKAWEESAIRVNLGPHDYRTFRTGDTIDVHGLEVEPIHVDHSVPGAYGFLIHTSEGTVVYTGDLRWHGPHGEMTDDFLEAATDAHPMALITEGTRMAPKEKRKNYTEQEVFEGAVDVIRGAQGRLVVATSYPRDIDRMRTFYMASLEVGRQFITSARTAFLLKALETDTGLRFPKVFRDYDAKAYFRNMLKESGWEKELKEELGDRAVDARYIHEHQGEVVLQLDFTHLTELVDIDPTPGGHFIHSKSEPFEEEDIEDAVLRAWLQRFELHHHQLHASGHASRSELETMVERMRPRKVVPIHTEHPQLFVGLAEKVELPEVGKPIAL